MSLYNLNLKKFYTLWLPIWGAILTQFSFSITDSVMIAPFGEAYLGGVGIAGIYYTITLVFFNGFLDIFSNLLARKMGERPEGINLSPLLITLGLIILTATIGAFFTLSFGHFTLSLFGLSQEILTVSSNHLSILSYGAIFSIGYYACVILLRVLGKANTTFWIVLSGSILNLCGNWLLLYGPLSHVFQPENAVAWTTILSRCLMLIIMFISVWGTIKTHLSTSNKPFSYINESIQYYWFILKKGTPTCARNLNDWLASFILVLLIGQFGTSCSAANQATDLISSTMYMFTQASCTTIGILFSRWIGENLSFKNFDFEIKRMFIVASIPSIVIFLGIYFFQGIILDLFSLEKGGYTRELAEIILFIHLVTLPLYTIQHIANALLDALFDTKVPSLFTLITSYVFVLPTAYYGVYFCSFPPYSIWIIDGAGMLIISIFLLTRLRFKTTEYSQKSTTSLAVEIP